MSIKKLIGLRIKELRLKNGYTQFQLAEAVGIDPKHQSCVETGRNFPSADLLEAYTKALNVSVDEMFKLEHHDSEEFIKEKIIQLLQQSSESDLRLIYRVVMSVLR